MAPPATHDLAQRLIAFEAARADAPDARVDVAVQVVEELRVRLVKLAGIDGFRSLLFRALTLAKTEVPALQTVRVCADGFLNGFDEIESNQGTETTKQAGTILVTHLLELLITFIGEPLTLNLVRDVWPDASVNGANSRTREKT